MYDILSFIKIKKQEKKQKTWSDLIYYRIKKRNNWTNEAD